MQAYLAEHSQLELCTNHARTADGIIEWLITEELGDLDCKKHQYLSEHYPTVIPQSAPTETREEKDQRRQGIVEDLQDQIQVWECHQLSSLHQLWAKTLEMK